MLPELEADTPLPPRRAELSEPKRIGLGMPAEVVLSKRRVIAHVGPDPIYEHPESTALRIARGSGEFDPAHPIRIEVSDYTRIYTATGYTRR